MRKCGMNRSARLKTLLCFVLITFSNFSAEATEIRLKSRCYCDSTLVRLGDIAEVYDADEKEAARLANIELFPAPDRTRTVKLLEIQERLSLHGVNLARCRLSGANSVSITVDGEQATKTYGSVAKSRATEQQARQRIQRALVQYLQARADSRFAWEVATRLDNQSSRLIAGANSRLVVQGGREPWVGPQEFIVTFQTAQGEVRLAIPAEVKLPQEVVVAVRPLRKGDTVRAEHVRLQPAPIQFSQKDYFHRLDEVLGKEAFRSINVGQPLDKKSVRSPLLVRRGDIVDVYSRAAGIQVHTTAVAREDGSKGDLITIQTLNRKQKFVARVSKLQEVEVFASGTTVKTTR